MVYLYASAAVVKAYLSIILVFPTIAGGVAKREHVEIAIREAACVEQWFSRVLLELMSIDHLFK
jgi:hypothetical protein